MSKLYRKLTGTDTDVKASRSANGHSAIFDDEAFWTGRLYLNERLMWCGRPNALLRTHRYRTLILWLVPAAILTGIYIYLLPNIGDTCGEDRTRGCTKFVLSIQLGFVVSLFGLLIVPFKIMQSTMPSFIVRYALTDRRAIEHKTGSAESEIDVYLDDVKIERSTTLGGCETIRFVLSARKVVFNDLIEPDVFSVLQALGGRTTRSTVQMRSMVPAALNQIVDR